MNEIPLTHALVADDEPHIGRIIKMKLEQGPFRVTLVYDGREALEILRRDDDAQEADRQHDFDGARYYNGRSVG